MVEHCEAVIKSIELQLVRVETCGCAEGYSRDGKNRNISFYFNRYKIFQKPFEISEKWSISKYSKICTVIHMCIYMYTYWYIDKFIKLNFTATEIQNIQIGEGNVCTNFAIPIYMIFPRLFTCPTLSTSNFKVGKNIVFIILLPISIYL